MVLAFFYFSCPFFWLKCRCRAGFYIQFCKTIRHGLNFFVNMPNPIGSMYVCYINGNIDHQYTPVMLAYIYIYHTTGSVVGTWSFSREYDMVISTWKHHPQTLTTFASEQWGDHFWRIPRSKISPWAELWTSMADWKCFSVTAGTSSSVWKRRDLRGEPLEVSDGKRWEHHPTNGALNGQEKLHDIPCRMNAS